MKANELRLGNLVYYTVTGRNKLIGEITGLNKTVDGLKAVIDYHYPSSFGEPIPLTPSILEAAGFNFHEPDSIFRTGVYRLWDDIHYNCVKLIPSLQDSLYSLQGSPVTKIIYLHQLQNLYFALTGTELEIDINKLK